MASETPTTLEQLQQENQALRARVAALEETVRQLQNDQQKLQEKLGEAQRASARQAAPFRRPERTKVPEGRKKRPGRPPGHPGACRAVPTQIDEQAEVPLGGCPCCGGPLSQVGPVEQFIEDLPPRRPHVTRIVTYKGTCPSCGEVQSTHPLQMSEATGAAKVQLGPRAVALAVVLNKRFGLTIRTSCHVLDQLGGLRVTPGGLTQAFERVTAKFTSAYDHRLIDDQRQAGGGLRRRDQLVRRRAGLLAVDLHQRDDHGVRGGPAPRPRGPATGLGGGLRRDAGQRLPLLLRPAAVQEAQVYRTIRRRSPKHAPARTHPTRAT